jgi:starvation-inducible DNA-binding protein
MSFIAQGYHWNIKGTDFREYHAFFGSIYEDVYGSVDGLAENILKLGYDAPFTLASLAAMSPLGTHTVDVNSCNAMAYDLYIVNKYIVEQLKNGFMVADAANEQGVADFLAERIDEHMKWAWQLRSSSVPEEVGEIEDEMGESDEPYVMVFSAFEKQGVLEAALVASADDRQARVESFASITEFAKFTEKEREKLAKKGEALPDGSYPIRNVQDLKNAIRAYGRSPLKGRMDVRKHIIKRALDLDARDLIPEQWSNPKNSPNSYSVDELRDRITSFSARVDELKKAQAES